MSDPPAPTYPGSGPGPGPPFIVEGQPHDPRFFPVLNPLPKPLNNPRTYPYLNPVPRPASPQVLDPRFDNIVRQDIYEGLRQSGLLNAYSPCQYCGKKPCYNPEHYPQYKTSLRHQHPSKLPLYAPRRSQKPTRGLPPFNDESAQEDSGDESEASFRTAMSVQGESPLKVPLYGIMHAKHYIPRDQSPQHLFQRVRDANFFNPPLHMGQSAYSPGQFHLLNPAHLPPVSKEAVKYVLCRCDGKRIWYPKLQMLGHKCTNPGDDTPRLNTEFHPHGLEQREMEAKNREMNRKYEEKRTRGCRTRKHVKEQSDLRAEEQSDLRAEEQSGPSSTQNLSRGRSRERHQRQEKPVLTGPTEVRRDMCTVDSGDDGSESEYYTPVEGEEPLNPNYYIPVGGRVPLNRRSSMDLDLERLTLTEESRQTQSDTALNTRWTTA